jgi:RimJ/RimL family protein N-acetyltransferase
MNKNSRIVLVIGGDDDRAIGYLQLSGYQNSQHSGWLEAYLEPELRTMNTSRQLFSTGFEWVFDNSRARRAYCDVFGYQEGFSEALLSLDCILEGVSEADYWFRDRWWDRHRYARDR